MLKSIRKQLGSRGATNRATGDPEALAERIAELTAANREERSLETERELLRLRHWRGAALVREDRPAPADEQRQFGDTDGEGLAVAELGDLDGARVRGGILSHGYVLIRDAIPRSAVESMADGINRAFAARESGDGEPGIYEEFKPGQPYGPIKDRAWITAGGGVLAADSPILCFTMLELLERAGLRRIIGEFLGEPATISVEKSTLRKAEPGPAGGWHQDGSFMGRTRALNVWVALSDCGVDAPGLDFVPLRIDELIETGTEGSGAEHLDRPDDEEEVTAKTVLISPQAAERAGGERGVVRPSFRAGDVMLFDDRFLHRTGSEPEMPKPRYAIESWFFGASGFPRDYTPLAV